MEENKTMEVGKLTSIEASESPYTLPNFSTNGKGKYIKWLDSDGVSQWPDKLLEYKSKSSLHGRITRSIIHQIIGEEFIYDTSSNKALLTKEFLDKENKDGDNLFKIWKKFVEDEYLFGTGSLILVYEKSKSSILSVEHINRRQLRATPVENGRIPGWVWAWDWNKTPKDGDLLFIPSNDFNSAKNVSNEFKKAVKTTEESLKAMKVSDVNKALSKIEEIFGSPNIGVEVHSPTRDTTSFYYPSFPTYISGLSDIRSDIKRSEYNLNKLSNGMNIDSVLTVYGLNSTEEKTIFQNDFNAQYRNPDRGSQTMMIFAPDQEHKPELTSFNPNNEAMLYTKITDDVTNGILYAHGITTPLLVAVSKPGQLGGTNEIEKGSELFYENVILPLQMTMLETFNKIMKYNELETLNVKRLKNGFTSTN